VNGQMANPPSCYFSETMTEKKIILPETLLEGYRNGIFPMSESRKDEDVEWFSARQRGIIPILYRSSGSIWVYPTIAGGV